MKEFKSSCDVVHAAEVPKIATVIEHATGLVDYVRATRNRLQTTASILGVACYDDMTANETSYQEMAMQEMMTGGRSYLQTLTNAMEILRMEADETRNVLTAYENQIVALAR